MMPPGMIPQAGGHPPPQMVQAILNRLHGPGGPGPAAAAGPPPPDENGKGLSPLEAVQSVIEDLHQLARIVQDPNGVKTVTGCLNQMAGLQSQMMAQGGGK